MNEARKALKEILVKREAYIKAQNEFDAARQAFADQHCPYKVGDVVSVRGFSFRGKMCSITSANLTSAFRLVVYGRVLKKDGTPSSNGVDWCDWHDDSLKMKNIVGEDE